MQQLQSRRRDRVDIFVEILEFCRQPQPKNRIMYNTNMSYNMLQKYLKYLLKYKFLDAHHSREMYAITEKGLEFLRRWMALQLLLEPSKAQVRL